MQTGDFRGNIRSGVVATKSGLTHPSIGAKLNKKEAVIHYETQARAALYPELVAMLTMAADRFADLATVIRERGNYDNAGFMDASADRCRALLSRLPAERDKEWELHT